MIDARYLHAAQTIRHVEQELDDLGYGELASRLSDARAAIAHAVARVARVRSQLVVSRTDDLAAMLADALALLADQLEDENVDK